MRRMWRDIKSHRIVSALFLAYWLFVLGLDFFRWHKPPDRPADIVPVVIWLHLLMVPAAGAAVLVIDLALILGAQFIDLYDPSAPPGGESPFEVPPLFIAAALPGSLLGLLGAGIAATLWRSRGRVSAGVPGVPSRALWTAAAIAAGVAALIGVAMIPALMSSRTAGDALHGAAILFALNAGINLLIAGCLAALVRYGTRAVAPVRQTS